MPVKEMEKKLDLFPEPGYTMIAPHTPPNNSGYWITYIPAPTHIYSDWNYSNGATAVRSTT